MGDEPVVVLDRGVLTAPDEVWSLAVRRAEVRGRLAQSEVVGREAADAADDFGYLQWIFVPAGRGTPIALPQSMCHDPPLRSCSGTALRAVITSRGR
jgi:hypothetical protein